MIVNDSSKRLTRWSKGKPNARYSRSFHPAPSATIRRPPETASTVAACLASIAGAWNPTDATSGPISTRSVSAASAAIATATSRVELGPLVASTSFHAPAMLAKQAATVDAISDGRLIVGLGAGWNEREYRAFGFPFDHRVGRFEEAFTIIRTLLRDGEIDYAGVYHSADHAVLHPRPVRPGGPPLMVGSVSPRMLAITLPHVDAWNVWWSDFANSPSGFAEVKGRVDAALVDIGRDPSSVAATCAVHVRLPGGTGRQMGEYGGGPVVEPIQGSPAEIADQLRAFADAGATHVQLVLDPITRSTIESLADVLAELDR